MKLRIFPVCMRLRALPIVLAFFFFSRLSLRMRIRQNSLWIVPLRSPAECTPHDTRPSQGKLPPWWPFTRGPVEI